MLNFRWLVMHAKLDFWARPARLNEHGMAVKDDEHERNEWRYQV